MKTALTIFFLFFAAAGAGAQTWAEWLKNFPRKQSTVVHDWRGNVLKTSSLGVLDIDVTELQQCADAIIRLRAEYLYSTQQYGDMQFKLTSGLNVPFSKWANGYRVKVSGNSATLVRQVNESDNYSRANFNAWLRIIMMYAGTASLARDLKSKHALPEIGDVLVIGGFPGHAIIVIDKIVHNGISYYLFAQSWMPAQDIEIVEGFNMHHPNYMHYMPIVDIDDCITVMGYDYRLNQHLKCF